MESLHPSFQYSLVIYICIYIAVNFTKSKLMAGSVPVLNLPEKCINPASKNICYYILFTLKFRWNRVHFSQTFHPIFLALILRNQDDQQKI